MSFDEVLMRHQQRAVPIVLIDNAIDQQATVNQVLTAVKSESGNGMDMLFLWSLCDGLQTAGSTSNGSFNSADRYLQDAVKKPPLGGFTTSFLQALIAIGHIIDMIKESGKDEKAGFVFYMGDYILNKHNNDSFGQCIQKLMQLRDRLKGNQCCIYLVGTDFSIPKELKEHIVVLQAPLPTEDEYKELIDECYDKYRGVRDLIKDDEVGNFVMTPEANSTFIETVKGSSRFAAEQTIYLSTDRHGMHIEEMRQRSIQLINSTRGLSVLQGDGQGFDAIGGLSSIKQYATMLTNGRLKPKLLILLDEIDKMHGGSGSDSSGVSQNFLGTQLTRMQETNSLGMLLTGIYGCGKSEFAKRWGEEANVLTLHMSMSDMKDSLVGNSEANMRRALDVIESIGGRDGGIIYMASCNRISVLPPEFKRRFNLGTFFFYFPDKEEADVIWDIYMSKYELLEDTTRSEIRSDRWTGAEIESCCRLAYLMQCTIAEAATKIVPVADTAKTEIDQLVDEAVGKYLSCSQPGVFTKPSAGKKYLEEKGRQANFN